MTKLAVRVNHSVSVFVRDASKVSETFDARTARKLIDIHCGNAVDRDALARAVSGKDVVIECLGNADRPAAIEALIDAVTVEGCPSFIAMGGSPALLLPNSAPAGPHLGMQRMADLHLNTLAMLRASQLPGWTQVCPSRLSRSKDAEPTGKFVVRPNIIDLAVYTLKIDLTYEDVAVAIINAADVKASGFHGTQMAFAVRDDLRADPDLHA